MLGRDLVSTIKLAQFLTDRSQSGTNRLRMLPGVYWAKKLKKEVKKIHVMGVIREWFSDYHQTRSVLKIDRAQNGTNRFRILPGMSRTKKILKKDAVDGRHLVITVKLGQFLTDRTQSGINRFRMLPGVFWAKKNWRRRWKKIQGRGRDQGAI